MVSRLSGGRAGAWLAVVPVTVTAAVLGLVVPAASASAGSPATDAALVTATAPASATPAAARRIRFIMLSTRVRGLHVRTRPSNRSPLVAKLGKRGTRVTITCWTTGTSVVGNTVWYHLSGPRKGYVTSYYINNRTAPYPGLARCKGPFRGHYRSRTAGVRVRTGPGAKFRVVHKLGRAGTRVTVTCWTRGEAIWGDHAWYHLSSPRRGYTAGFHLNTGRDPAAGVPRC
jgi:hypothetical protein